eukprot:COSAG05_NODE_156_length_15696_cov_359.955440_13_plen_74_part_00
MSECVSQSLVNGKTLPGPVSDSAMACHCSSRKCCRKFEESTKFAEIAIVTAVKAASETASLSVRVRVQLIGHL